MSNISAYLIFGAPGSGKGTVGAKLAATTGVKHLSTGDIFRGLSPASENGKLFASYANAGKLVPDEVTVQIFFALYRRLDRYQQIRPHERFFSSRRNSSHGSAG